MSAFNLLPPRLPKKSARKSYRRWVYCFDLEERDSSSLQLFRLNELTVNLDYWAELMTSTGSDR